MERLRQGMLVRHFKGKTYKMLEIATHVDSGARLVIYQALYDDFIVYAREYDDFMGAVDKSKYPEAAQDYKFVEIPPYTNWSRD